jgi:hypothetical protein
MKKPSSIRGHVRVLSSTVSPYQKIRTVFSLRALIHEFFQKKINYIKATKFFHYEPLTTSLVRLTPAASSTGVITRFEKKHYPWSDSTTKTPWLFSYMNIVDDYDARNGQNATHILS